MIHGVPQAGGALAALPAGAGYDGKVAAKVLLGVDHLGKLADGQGVASGERIAAHKVLHTGAQSCTLDDLSAQRVGAVQHHQPLARPGAILDEVGQRGEEGVVPLPTSCISYTNTSKVSSMAGVSRLESLP